MGALKEAVEGGKGKAVKLEEEVAALTKQLEEGKGAGAGGGEEASGRPGGEEAWPDAALPALASPTKAVLPTPLLLISPTAVRLLTAVLGSSASVDPTASPTASMASPTGVPTGSLAG